VSTSLIRVHSGTLAQAKGATLADVIDWEYQEGATWSWPADYADFRWGSEVGFDTPEEAAAPEIPPPYVCIVSVAYHPDGDHAVVELLTNEEPRLYPYTVFCIRDSSGRWHEGSGHN
jgi:hypothetical protein